jgi:hypothetical protein
MARIAAVQRQVLTSRLWNPGSLMGPIDHSGRKRPAPWLARAAMIVAMRHDGGRGHPPFVSRVFL